MTRWAQERTARAGTVPGASRGEGSAPRRSSARRLSLLDHVKTTVSLFLKEQWYCNSDKQKLCHLALLQEDRIRKGP